MQLAEKKIVVGVTGGIASYKSCELIRELKRAGASVRVVMTESARRFVSELTFATLSENPVALSMFDGAGTPAITHIELSRWSDVFVISPATANFIGKVASGIADDLLSTAVMATRAPVLICPAMNPAMWDNRIVQENVRKLKQFGFPFVGPEWGEMATREEGDGWGRLAELPVILQYLQRLLLGDTKLQGKRVLVTAGPTRQAIDPVRYLSNYSSGKMGFALAEAAWMRGADVTLVAGPNHLRRPADVRYCEVQTAGEMQAAIERFYPDSDVLLMAAAVSDYAPEVTLRQKLKKEQNQLNLRLQKTPDILAGLAAKKSHRIHVGFALETEHEEKNALSKLQQKALDLIVLNNPLQEGAGFAADTNIVQILDRQGQKEKLPKLSKEEVARRIVDKVCDLLEKQNKRVLAV